MSDSHPTHKDVENARDSVKLYGQRRGWGEIHGVSYQLEVIGHLLVEIRDLLQQPSERLEIEKPPSAPAASDYPICDEPCSHGYCAAKRAAVDRDGESPF